MQTKNITQESLAKLAGVSVRTIQNAVALKKVSAKTRDLIAKGLELKDASSLTTTTTVNYTYEQLKNIQSPSTIARNVKVSKDIYSSLNQLAITNSLNTNGKIWFGAISLLVASLVTFLLPIENSWPIMAAIFAFTAISLFFLISIPVKFWQEEIRRKLSELFTEKVRNTLACTIRDSINAEVYSVLEHSPFSDNVAVIKSEWDEHIKSLLHNDFDQQLMAYQYFFSDPDGYYRSVKSLNSSWQNLLAKSKLNKLNKGEL